MSRDYDQYCIYCKEHNSRSDYIGDSTELFQCLSCGKIWYKTSKAHELALEGISETMWHKAVDELLEILVDESHFFGMKSSEVSNEASVATEDESKKHGVTLPSASVPISKKKKLKKVRM